MFCPKWGGWSKGTGRGAQNLLRRPVPLLVCELDRRQRSQAGMRTNVIVVVAPGLDDRARFVQADEHVFVKAFVSQPAVEALDESIHPLKRGKSKQSAPVSSAAT